MRMRVERNAFLDVLRGVAILIVVLGHALQNANGGVPSRDTAHWIIMTFQMPLFFMIAGYADGMTHGGSGLRSKIFRLLVPYLAWAQIAFAVETVFRGVDYSFAKHLLATLCGGPWFLRTLFCIWLSCYTYRKVDSWCVNRMGGNKDCLRIFGAVVAALGVLFVLDRGAILHYFPLYVIGILIFKAKDVISVRLQLSAMIAGSLAFGIEAYALVHMPVGGGAGNAVG